MDLRITCRQREVLTLLARGMSNKEIARALGTAEATVKVHTAALLRFFGVRNRTEAALAALRDGYVMDRLPSCYDDKAVTPPSPASPTRRRI